MIYPNQDCVDRLLAAGSDPYVKDRDGKVPLHWAAYCNVPFKIFSQLASVMDHNLDTADRYGRTPLHYICLREGSSREAFRSGKCNSLDVILKLNLLFHAKVNLDAADVEGNTPPLILCSNVHNFAEADEICFDEIPEDLKSLRSKSLCGLALEMFLNQGCDYQAQNQHGMTPFHFACKSVCVEMVRLLISRIPNASIPLDATDNTPMSLIFTSKSACLSLRYTANIPEWFPLSDHKCRFEDTLRPVLKHMKSSVNIPKKVSGFTALYYALQNIEASSNVVKGLIEYGGAEVNHKNFLGKSPLHYAPRPQIFVSSPLKETLFENWRNKVLLLLQNNAVVDNQDLWGNSPLHEATLYFDMNLIELLIEKGANVNLKNKFGATPIHLICLNAEMPSVMSAVVDRLISLGASVNCQDVHGSTPLHYAVYSGNRDIIIKLIEQKANIYLTDENGLSPKQYSGIIGHTQLSSCFPDQEEMKGVQKQEEIHEVPNQEEITEEKSGCFLMPVKISNVTDWLKSNMLKVKLSDDQVIKLLLSTETSRLSNSASENIVLRQLLGLMTAVFDEVERLDSRFKVTVELSGSTREGTKVETPDEFDLLCILDNFESICETEEYGTDFVLCRLKEKTQSELYQNLFDENKLLLGNRLTTAFYVCIRKALSNPGVWKSAPGFSMDKSLDDYPSERDVSGIRCLYLRFCDATYKDLAVSCDIVPAIRKKEWWPSFANQEGGLVSRQIKENGCLVIPKPHLETTLSGERIRLPTYFKASVYLSECSVLLSLPPAILRAYKLAKLLLKKTNLYPPVVEDAKWEGNLFHLLYHFIKRRREPRCGKPFL